MKGFWSLIGILWVVFSAEAQNSTQAGVKLLTRAHQNEIKLRWAPTSPLLWQYGLQYGYRLEKLLVYQNGQVLPKPRPLTLAKVLFRAAPQAKWQPYLEKDAQATVAYQAMFGEKMQVSSNNKILKLVEQAEQQQLRFTFALMAADYSAIAAQLSGLSFTDKQVKKGEKYLYRIRLNLPAGIQVKTEAGNAYVGTDDYAPLPKPLELDGKFGDKNVLLVWNQLYYQRIYSGYFIERSEDGKKYQLTSQLPHAVFEKDTLQSIPQRYMTVVDSLPQNNKTYYFRVRGLTPFAELGPPSDSIVTGQGKSQNEWQVVLEKPTIKKQQVILHWQVSDKIASHIKGFKVAKAAKAQGKYQSLHTGLLAAGQKLYVDSVASGATYYQVKAIGKNGEEATSFPHLVQLPDTIPPDAPVVLAGVVDTLGAVTLRWAPPNAKDVRGYHVFRSEGENDEYSRINVTVINDTTFADSINLRSLNPYIHYKIQAVDQYFNPSPLSKMLRLKRPDKIPPLSPVFVRALSTDSSLTLQWQASASQDVARHLLYRAEMGKDQWQLIANFTQLDTSALQQVQDTSLHNTQYIFQDETANPGRQYQYTLVAVDSSHLESPPSRPVSARRIARTILPAVKQLRASQNFKAKWIELEWQYSQPQVTAFRIYRAKGEANLTLYKTIEVTADQATNLFQDKQVAKGLAYRYQVQAVSPGKVAKFSKVIQIRY
ncbi:MAG TPA: hypothetical protein DCS93_00010 [Microscillaceae bacterium]|nr:hypothetical protein [Microscillaceae bacterium]